jgi:hypothetical protein
MVHSMGRARLLGLLLSVLAVPPARAHVPHQTMAFLAVPADLDPDLPWLGVLRPTFADLLLRADTPEAAGWSILGGAPTVDVLEGGAVLPDGTIVLLGDGRLWVSTDGGTSWWFEALPAEVGEVAAAGPTLLLAGQGLWRWSLADGFVAERPEPVIRALGGGGVALDAVGDLWLRDGRGHWTRRAGPGGPVLSAAATTSGVVFVGDNEGRVLRDSGDGWSTCAALPDPPKEQPSEARGIVALALDGDQLLAATGWRAPFVGALECDEWRDLAAPLDADYLGDGGVTDPREAYTGLVAADGRWLVAGWAGLARSDDAGESWTRVAVLPHAYSRGISWSVDYDQDGLILSSGTSSGLVGTCDGGQSFMLAPTGLDAPNVQRVLPHPATSNELWSIVGHLPYASRDRGMTWGPVEPPNPQPSAIAWTPDGLWAVGGGDPGQAVSSRDRAGAWQVHPDVLALMGESVPVGAAAAPFGGVLRTCIVGQEPLRTVCRDGMDGAWTLEGSGGGGAVTRPVGWRGDADTGLDGHSRMVVGVGDRVLSFEAFGPEATTVLVLDDDTVAELHAADDHTLVLGTLGGRFYWSPDGGESWQDAGVQLNAPALAMASAPDFAARPEVLVGSFDGTFLLRLGEVPTLERWGGLERVDDRVLVEDCTLCRPLRSDAAAPVGTLLPLGQEGVLTVQVRGSRLEVYGQIEGFGQATVWVDGVEVGVISGAADDAVVSLFEVEGLAPGWHELRLVASVEGVLVDAVDGWMDAVAVDAQDATTGPCARVGADAVTAVGRCGGCGGSGALVLVPLVGFRWSRRRRLGRAVTKV